MWRNGRRVSISPAQSGLLSVGLGDGRTRVPKTLVQRVLWGEANSRAVRHRASQLVYQTNQRCGARVLAMDGEFVRVRWDIVACDLPAFLEMVSERRFEAACDFLERGFLPAFPRWKEEELADWIEERRAGVRTRLRSASLAGWHAAEAAQDWAAARQASQALLRIDPKDELMLRRAMRAQAMGGRVREAEAVYRAFADRSRDWSPQPETRKLLHSVQGWGPSWAEGRGNRQVGGAAEAGPRRRTGANAPARGGPGDDRGGEGFKEEPDGLGPRYDDAERRVDGQAPGPPEDVPFRGRDDALGRVNRALHGAGGGVATISGESGIGKTRLGEVATLGARVLGVGVARARLEEADRQMRLSTLAVVLGQPWIREAAARNELPRLPFQLESLPPEAERRPGSAPAVAGVSARQAARGIRRWFRALGRARRVLLFIDDFHYADEESALILRAIGGPGGAPVRLLLTYREDALRWGSAAARCLRSLEAEAGATRIRLRGLGDEAARQVAVAARRAAPGRSEETGAERSEEATLLEAAVRLAGGNPRFLIELARQPHAVEAREDGGTGVPLRAPPSVRRFVQERLDVAGAAGRKTAAGLAAFGEPASLGQVARLAACSPGECVDAVERLEEAGLLEIEGERADVRISFRHGIVRRAVYEATTAARRVFAHGVAAELALSGPRGSGRLDRVAHHCHLAGNRAGAREHALSAAKETAPRDVASRLSLLFVARQASNGAERHALSVRLAQEHWTAVRTRRALELGEAALRDAAEPAGTPAADVLELKFLVAKARRQLGTLSPDVALVQLEEIESAATGDGHEDLRVRTLDARWAILAGLDDGVAAAKLLDRCAALAPRLRSEHAKRRRLAMLAAGGVHGRPGEALNAGRQLLSLVQSQPEPDRLFLTARGVEALAASGLLETPEGRAAVVDAKACAAESADLRSRVSLALELAEWQIGIGHHRAGEAALDEARLLMAPPAHCPPVERRLLLAAAELALARRDLARAGERIASLHALSDVHADRRHERALAATEGDLLLQLGKVGRAADLAARHPPGSAMTPPAGLFPWHARLLARTQRVGEAVSLLERGLEELGRHRSLPWLRIALDLVRLSRRTGAPRRALAATAQARAQELGLAALAQEFGPFAR